MGCWTEVLQSGRAPTSLKSTISQKRHPCAGDASGLEIGDGGRRGRPDRISRFGTNSPPERLAGDPPDVNITPRVGHIGLLEFDRAEELIREGEEAVEDKRPELMDAMQSIGFPSRL